MLRHHVHHFDRLFGSLERDRSPIANRPTLTLKKYSDGSWRLSPKSRFKILSAYQSLPAVLHRGLSSIQDDRRFHPLGSARPAKTVAGSVATVSPKYRKAKVFRGVDGKPMKAARVTPFSRVRRVFNAPFAVIPCIRRKVRREVILALYGGGASHNSKRRNWTSEIGC